MPQPQTEPLVHELFLAALERFPNRTFLHTITGDIEKRMTYRETASVLIGTIEALRASGIRSGDRVVCYADEIVPSIYFMLSCAFEGIVFCPLSPNFSAGAAVRLMERIWSRCLFTTPDHAARVRGHGVSPFSYVAAGEEIEGVRPIEMPRAPREQDAERLRAGCEGRSAEETYIILPTSGTTGEPKLSVRSHGAVTLQVLWQSEALELSAERPERILLCSGLTHGMGQQLLSLGISLAAEFCIPEGVEAAASLEQVRRLDPTIVRSGPRVVKSLYRQHLAAGGAPAERFFGPSLNLLRTSGSPMSPELLKILADQGIDAGEIYGSAEGGAIAVTPRHGWRPGYIGKVLPAADVKIADDGEILVRSACGMAGYYGDDALTKETFTDDGFMRTGDIGELRADGYIRIIGRKKEVLNAPDGTNIYAARIEELIAGLPWVHQVVLLGDQRPFIAALIVVKDSPVSTEGRALLPEALHGPLYERARNDLAAINERLEPIERVRGFALFARPFAPDLYGIASGEKIKRDRRAINTAYGDLIEALYSPGSERSIDPERRK